MASIKGFLTAYFKQLHFNAMTPEVRDRWNEYLKLGDLNNTMKDWCNQLMEKTTEDGKDKYTEFNLPNIEKGQNPNREGDGKPGDPGLTDAQIIELYKYMNEAVSGMAEDKRLKNTEFAAAKAFVDDFYGQNNLFNIIPLEESAIQKLADLYANADLLKPILTNKSVLLDGLGLTYDELLQGIADKKYDKDAGFRLKLETIIDNLASMQYYGLNIKNAEQEKLVEEIIALKDKLNPEPSKHSVERFKKNYGAVLQRLYENSKTKELFADHDQHGIISALESARGEVNYDKPDSDNYIYPKTKKQLNPAQTIKKKWDDLKENRLDKWKNLAGDRMFESRAAEDIVKQIKKEGIKPTDGLAAIIDKADTIKSKMPHTSIQTGKHFEWFINELKDLKDKDDKSFEACLYNGISLRKLVERLIKDAVKADKIAEAKTALEILSVIKYENTTSKTLDAIKSDKDLFTFFSNPDMSWNKNNEAIRLLMLGVDKVIRIGGIAVATTATFAFNSLRKMGSKIRTESDILSKAHSAKTAQWTQDKAALAERISASEQNQKAKQDEYDNFVATNGDGDALDKKIKAKKKILDKHSKAIDDFKENQDLKKNFQALQQFLESGAASEADLAAIQQYWQQYSAYIQGKSTIKPSIAGISKTCPIYGNIVQLNNLLSGFDATKRAFNRAQTKLTDVQKMKQDFVNATNALKSAEDEHKRNTDEMDNWDKNHMDRYDELVDHWNKLEFGRDLHLGRLFRGHYSHLGSKKKRQDNFYLKFNNGMTGKNAYQA